jgi:transcriptional regulator with XRE-family HTH domain
VHNDGVKNLIMEAFASAPRGTQAQVAAALNLPAPTINKWAQGHTIPEPHRWPDLERLLNLPDGTLARASGISTGRTLDDLLGLIEAVAVRVDALERLVRPDGPPPGQDGLEGSQP